MWFHKIYDITKYLYQTLCTLYSRSILQDSIDPKTSVTVTTGNLGFFWTGTLLTLHLSQHGSNIWAGTEHWSARFCFCNSQLLFPLSGTNDSKVFKWLLGQWQQSWRRFLGSNPHLITLQFSCTATENADTKMSCFFFTKIFNQMWNTRVDPPPKPPSPLPKYSDVRLPVCKRVEQHQFWVCGS